MMRAALVVLVGCGTAAVPVQPPVAKPVAVVKPVVAPVGLPIPAPLAPTTTQRVCSKAVQPAPVAGKMRVYEFTPTKIAPKTNGAVPVGYRRHVDSVRAGVAAEEDPIAACVQSAARRGVTTRLVVGGGGSGFGLTATFVVDPFGAAKDVVVEGEGDQAMRDCIRDALMNVRVARRTPRETLARVPLFLSGYTDGKWKGKPAVVRKEARYDRAGCLTAIDPMPRDVIDVPEIVIFWEPGNYGTPRTWCDKGDIDKTQIRRAMEDNRYAIEACYAKEPDVVGRIDTRFVIGSHGVATDVTSTGVGSAALQECLRAVIGDVNFGRSVSGSLQVNYPFELAPAVTQTFTADCAGRAAMIATYSVHDARAWAAIDEMAAAGCADSDALDRFARFGVPDGRVDQYRGRGLEEAIDASMKFLARFAPTPERLLFLGEALVSIGREEEARATLLRMLAMPNRTEKQIERAAEAYAKARAPDEVDRCEVSSPY